MSECFKAYFSAKTWFLKIQKLWDFESVNEEGQWVKKTRVS